MKGLKFRLYTEDINIGRVLDRCKHIGLDNITYYQVDGKFNGISEHSLIIECITPINNGNDISKMREKFQDLAHFCSMVNQQEKVLLTEEKLTFELV